MERNLGTLTKAKRKKQKILHIGKNVISLQSDSRRVLSTNTRETSLKGKVNIRGVAQLASASGLGPEGPVFESQYPDIETETDSPASVSVFIPPLPPERSRFCHPERSRFCHPERQRRIWSTTPVPAPANGPRTSTFCNPLRHSTIQNHFVRGPYFFEGITNNRFLQLSIFQ